MADDPHQVASPSDRPPDGSYVARARALIRRLGPVGPVAVISMTLPGVMGLVLVWASVKYADGFKPWIDHHVALALAIYAAGFALLAGLPVLPTYSISLLGGYLFGIRYGVYGSLAGYMGAAMVSYFFLRALSGNRVEDVLAEHHKWKIVRDELLVRSPWRSLTLVALLRVPPNLPFAVVNLVLVTARIRPGVYFAGTLLGVIPRTVAVVYIGATAPRLDFSAGGSWLYVAGIVLTLVVLAIISALAHRAIRRITERGGTPGLTPDAGPEKPGDPK